MRRGWIAALVLACVSCTAGGTGPDAQGGGMAGSTAGVGAPPVTAGAGMPGPAPAGSSAAGAGAGGAAGSAIHAGAGGAAGSGGAGGMGGAAGQSGTGGTGGTAGAAGAGTGGAGGEGAGGASAHVAVPSEGCGKSGRPSGGEVTVAGSHIYSFPESYDGTTPSPLIIAFHAAGNENDQLRNITRGSALDQHFVMAFPNSAGNGWSPNTDGASIDARYEELLASYCIDASRVFATGHSSGAQLIVQLMCSGDERFAAIAPVASSAYCPSWDDPIPSLIIHGADDKERANTNQDADGTKDLAPYLLSNQCGTTTTPHAQDGCSSSGTQVDPGCVQYQGCAEPTIWCHHDDPQYGTTNHGWPCFANDAIDAFFGGLP